MYILLLKNQQKRFKSLGLSCLNLVLRREIFQIAEDLFFNLKGLIRREVEIVRIFKRFTAIKVNLKKTFDNLQLLKKSTNKTRIKQS